MPPRTPTQLTFRTVNSSRSAYACFEFQRGFFSKYELTVDGEDETGEGYSINCKTLSKVRFLLLASHPWPCSVARHPLPACLSQRVLTRSSTSGFLLAPLSPPTHRASGSHASASFGRSRR